MANLITLVSWGNRAVVAKRLQDFIKEHVDKKGRFGKIYFRRLYFRQWLLIVEFEESATPKSKVSRKES